MRQDYFKNLRQGALNTFGIGCNLLGLGNFGSVRQSEETKQDEHHLSFDSTPRETAQVAWQESLKQGHQSSLTTLQLDETPHGQRCHKRLILSQEK